MQRRRRDATRATLVYLTHRRAIDVIGEPSRHIGTELRLWPPASIRE